MCLVAVPFSSPKAYRGLYHAIQATSRYPSFWISGELKSILFGEYLFSTDLKNFILFSYLKGGHFSAYDTNQKKKKVVLSSVITVIWVVSFYICFSLSKFLFFFFGFFFLSYCLFVFTRLSVLISQSPIKSIIELDSCNPDPAT